MLLLYAKYAFVFWLLIGSNNGDIQLMRQLSQDEELLSIAACTKRCLQQLQLQQEQQQPEPFRDCFELCKDNNGTAAASTYRKIQENFIMKLVCRTDESLTFRIDWVEHRLASNQSRTENSTSAIEDVLYIIKVNAVDVAVVKSSIYLSDDNFFTITKLENKTAHVITTLAVHGDGAYSIIASEQTFTTLKRGYQPSKMGEIKLRRFAPSLRAEDEHMAAEIEWQTSAERNCFYDIIWFSTDSQSMETPVPVLFREPRELYSHTIEGMEFGQQYKVGVRTVNPKNSLETDFDWIMFQTPACLEWHNFNYTLCAPLKPTNVSVLQQHYIEGNFSLNISWASPPYLPDYYTLHILDLHPDSQDMRYNVSGNASHFYISRIHLLGASFEVHLVAHTEGGSNATAIFLNKLPRIVWMEDGAFYKLILFVIVPIGCIVILSTFTVCKRKAKLKRQINLQRDKAKELKAAQNMAQSNDFHLSLLDNTVCLAALSANDDNLHLDDGLEVDPQHVVLLDVLGEGAFGLVRRGLYQKRQVAVKLLKDEPNEEDVHAFKCEINMLRSLGKHPNIVGIVGYSTKIPQRMMLLIEYCSLGNLQNFLREEWKLRQDQGARKLLQQVKNNDKERRRRPQLDIFSDTRIEDINCSTLEQIEEEAETSRFSNTVETYTLAMAATTTKTTPTLSGNKAADNKSYGLHENIENIDANSANLAADCLEAILRRKQAESWPSKGNKSHPPPTSRVTVENREYFGLTAGANVGIIEGAARGREPLRYADLLDIAQQVAVGMEFLAQNKVVHRDLAARNVLIALDRTIKIADFGLSRDVYHENVYRKSGGGKLPIKWLALESLTHQVYTSQSDVWSFGVLLYEIITLGGMPYPSISPSDLLQLLRQGQRMKRPEGCTDEMFALMESCWCSIPAQRPTFSIIQQRLAAMILANGEEPQRQQQQQNAKRQLNKLQSKVEQLALDDGLYLEPLQ